MFAMKGKSISGACNANNEMFFSILSVHVMWCVLHFGLLALDKIFDSWGCFIDNVVKLWFETS